MSIIRKVTAAAAGSLMLVGAVAAPSQAQRPVFQDGLVNVNITDVNILNNVLNNNNLVDLVDVNVADVADIIIQACGVDVGPVAAGILGQATAVDRSGNSRTVCEAGTGTVSIVQNN